MTKTEARERVARGAAFLDEQRPGWAERIDTGTLTLHDPCGCIVGQLCGTGDNFARGLETLGVWLPNSVRRHFGAVYEMGFDCDESIPANFMLEGAREAYIRDVKYAPLQNAWIEAIADRLVPTVAEGTAVDAVARTDEVVAGGPRASRT